MPFVELHHLTFQQDNARPHIARICRDYLEQEGSPVLNWLPYSPDMSAIKHPWDVLDRHVRHQVPVSQNGQLQVALQEERDIPQTRIVNLVMSMRRRCTALREANGGHTLLKFVRRPLCSAITPGLLF